MDQTRVSQGLEQLCQIDSDVKKALSQLEPIVFAENPKGFEAFLSTIVSQQLSTKVADIIMGRLVTLMEEVSAERLMQLSEQQLRDVGLSFRKIEYAKGLAASVLDGSFDIDGLNQLDDEGAIKAITQLRGLGLWSAEIYLLFSMGRQDIFPADDLGLLVAIGQLKGLKDRPTAKQARELVKHWSPWRSVGSLFLWRYYHQIQQIDN